MTNKEQKYKNALEKISGSCLIKGASLEDTFRHYLYLKSVAAEALDEVVLTNFDDIPA